jgi:hypothetical protein
VHYLKINKGVWLQKGSEDIIQLTNDFYLNLAALTSFSYYRLEDDLAVSNNTSVLKKWENYILESSLSGLEVIKFFIHVSDDLLLQSIETLLDTIDLHNNTRFRLCHTSCEKGRSCANQQS